MSPLGSPPKRLTRPRGAARRSAVSCASAEGAHTKTTSAPSPPVSLRTACSRSSSEETIARSTGKRLAASSSRVRLLCVRMTLSAPASRASCVWMIPAGPLPRTRTVSPFPTPTLFCALMQHAIISDREACVKERLSGMGFTKPRRKMFSGHGEKLLEPAVHLVAQGGKGLEADIRMARPAHAAHAAPMAGSDADPVPLPVPSAPPGGG